MQSIAFQQRMNKNKLGPSAPKPKRSVYQDAILLLGYRYPAQPAIFVKSSIIHPNLSLLFFSFLLSILGENCSTDGNTVPRVGDYLAADYLSILHSLFKYHLVIMLPRRISVFLCLFVPLFNNNFILPLGWLFFPFKLSQK